MNIKSPTQFLFLVCVISLILAGCTGSPASTIAPNPPAPTSTPGSYWPTKTWRTSSPDEQGMDSGKLAQMLAAIQQGQLNLHSLLVVRNGYLVSETYFGSDQDTRYQLYSCTKSFVSTLIGIAMDQGLIDRLDQRVVDFFPDYSFANLDQQKQSMTLDDVLTMRSGLDWQEGDPAYAALYRSSDWIQSMLDMPMALQPGTKFNYCSGCTHILSAIVHETTGMGTFDFAKKYLFKPLGITNVRWDNDAAGIPIGGWGLQLTPRDMAKLGYLFLRNGEWDGQQIISAKWVQIATQKHTDTDDDNRGYGYQWWTYPSLQAYMALGRYGQMIFVIPRLDLIVVTTAQLDNHDELFKLVEQYIVPSIEPAQD